MTKLINVPKDVMAKAQKEKYFCKKCGMQMFLSEANCYGFDTYTGKPKCEFTYQCPAYRFFNFHGRIYKGERGDYY